MAPACSYPVPALWPDFMPYLAMPEELRGFLDWADVLRQPLDPQTWTICGLPPEPAWALKQDEGRLLGHVQRAGHD